MRWKPVILVTAALAPCAYWACWWHDDYLWQEEDRGWIADAECWTEIRSLLPGNFKLPDGDSHERALAATWHGPAAQLPAHHYALVYEGEYRDEQGAISRRACRAIMIHTGYHRWSLHSLQIEGEPEQVVDQVHECDMRDDRWLGLGGP